MEITNVYRYNECIAAQTRIERIKRLLDALDSTFDDETVIDYEWDAYILTTRTLIKNLAEIANERVKSYITEAEGE